jgi:hypothetical protein
VLTPDATTGTGYSQTETSIAPRHSPARDVHGMPVHAELAYGWDPRQHLDAGVPTASLHNRDGQ